MIKVYFLRHGKAESRAEWRGDDGDRQVRIHRAGVDGLLRRAQPLIDLGRGGPVVRG